MFSEWTDPYDIDNYYNDLNTAFKDIQAAPSGNMYQQNSIRPKIYAGVEMKVEQPMGPVINSQAVEQPIEKSKFEVIPNSILSDGHPVGQQPKYNILRSAEGYCSPDHSFKIDTMHIMLFIILLFFIGVWINARSQVSQMRDVNKMLMAMFVAQGKGKPDNE